MTTATLSISETVRRSVHGKHLDTRRQTCIPPDPDPDPDPGSVPEPETSSPLNPPSPWGGLNGNRKRSSAKHRNAALAWFGIGTLATGHTTRAAALLDAAAAWELAKAKRPHVDNARERERIDSEWLALVEEVVG